MLTLVQIGNAHVPSEEAARLVADYLKFDRRRTERRQYLKAFGGMAALVLLGALFGRVALVEAEIVAGLLLSLPLMLAIIEAIQWYGLMRRLRRLRASVQERKS
jgi:hypothetical protein